MILHVLMTFDIILSPSIPALRAPRFFLRQATAPSFVRMRGPHVAVEVLGFGPAGRTQIALSSLGVVVGVLAVHSLVLAQLFTRSLLACGVSLRTLGHIAGRIPCDSPRMGTGTVCRRWNPTMDLLGQSRHLETSMADRRCLRGIAGHR